MGRVLKFKQFRESAMIRSLISLFLIFLSLSWSQTGNGTIRGTVYDLTGAVLPGAKITVTRILTADTREAVANEAGIYVLPSLPIGAYQIVAESQGLQTWEAELVLQVGQTASIDPRLAAAATTQEITVAGDVTQLVSVSNATLGQVLERSRIEQLPINGRFITTLVGVTTPGVEGTRVNGLREAALEFVQDGAVLTNRDAGGVAGRPPGIDTVDECKEETNN